MSSSQPNRVTRVLTLPIREIVDRQTSVLDTFKQAWRMSTALANWAQQELAMRDVVRTPDMVTLPKYDPKAMWGTVPRRFARKSPEVKVPFAPKQASKAGDPQVGSLYDLWNREYPEHLRQIWEGCSVSARDVMTAVEETWKGHKDLGRLAVIWRGEARAAVFRFPYPYPVPADKGKTLKLGRDSEGKPTASFPMPGGRVTVRLASDGNYRSQLRQFTVLLAEPERLQQAKVTGRFSGGRMVGADLRIVARFDVGSREGDKAATIRTGDGRLLTVEVEGRNEPFHFNGDDLPGVIAVHDKWRHRLAEDLKHEKRWPSDKRRRIVNGPRIRAKFDIACNRLRTARQQAAACVVGFLVRQGVSTVTYFDADKRFLPRFDWTGLRSQLKCKCEESSILFQHQAGSDDVN